MRWEWLLVPIPLALLLVFSTGVAMLLSALYVPYRDVRPIWEVTLQALFYATPILYPIELLAEHSPAIAKIALMNPIAALIQEARHLLVGAPSLTEALGSTALLAGPVVIGIGVTALGFWVFDRMAPRDQLHVAEEAGVAGVIDRFATDRDDEAGSLADRRAFVGRVRRVLRAGHRVRVKRLDELDRAPVELDRPAEVGVEGLLDAVRSEPDGRLDDRDRRGAGPLTQADSVGDVVGMAVGQKHVGRLNLFGRVDGDRIVGLEKRVDHHRRIALGDLEA